MPLHKNRPPTRKPCAGTTSQVASGSTPSFSSTTDKSNQAARMAQELASQTSWADRYVPTPSVTNATPAESVAESQSLLDMDDEELPPSYEASSLERGNSRTGTENVRQFSSPEEAPASTPARDVESGITIPLLPRPPVVIRSTKGQQKRKKRLIVVILILAVWLILVLVGFQLSKSLGIGFWHSDGTPIPPLPNRKYVQHETSSSISGTFTFWDELDLSTFSGPINIEIDPQPSENTGIIRLSTRSGGVKVRFSESYMKRIAESGTLDRTFDIEIRSSSGAQNHELPQGNGGTTSLISESGSITAKFFMTDSGRSANATKLVTKTSSASQQLKFKQYSSDSISTLAATVYSSNSGTIKMGLPLAWEGMIHASVGGSGSVDVKGEGLTYQRNGNKEMYAWRVHGDSNGSKTKEKPSIEGQVVEIRSDGSGSVKVDCAAS